MISAATIRRESRKRRVVAGVVLAWLGLLVQPCVADMPAMPDAGVEHCDHSGMPDHAASCHEVQAIDCEISMELNAGLPQAADAPHTGGLIAMLPADVGRSSSSVGAQLRALTTGPPLTIRFCNLRN
ncbi:MAG: hypothetical protein L6Q83_03585 [Gammaproteobacteria bacterium]|nr:hypothetical protein [Gammaproteobacteria bacterium]